MNALQPVAAADEDWSVDTSDAAVQARMGNLTSGVKGLALTDDTEKTQEERFNLFYAFVKVLCKNMFDARLHCAKHHPWPSLNE